MVGRAPSAGRPDVRRNVEVAGLLGQPLLVVIDVRHRGAAAAGDAARRPGLGLVSDQGSVLLGPDLDVAEVGRASARHHQLLVAVQHQLDGLAGHLRQLGAGDAPGVDVELRSEAAAHVGSDDVDGVRCHGADVLVPRQALGQVSRDPGDRLRGRVNGDVVAGPVHHLAVRLEAAVGDDGKAVVAFHRGVGALPGLFEIRPLGVVLGGLDAVGRARLLNVLVLDPVGHGLVQHGHCRGCVADVLFGIGADREDLGAGPLHLVADIEDVHVALVAGGLFCARHVDANNAPVGNRGGHQLGKEHSVEVAVVGVLRCAAGLRRSVYAVVSLADQTAVFSGWPIVLGCHCVLSSLGACRIVDGLANANIGAAAADVAAQAALDVSHRGLRVAVHDRLASHD